MAEYKEIHGTKIRNYTTNPDNPIVGEVWYNDTDNVLKFQYPAVTTTGSWASAPVLNTGRVELAGAGTSTAALMFGGNTGPLAQTELFNGSSFSEVNDLNTGRYTLGGTAVSYTHLTLPTIYSV